MNFLISLKNDFEKAFLIALSIESSVGKQFITLFPFILPSCLSPIFIVGILTLLFRSTIEKLVAGLMIFMGNDYNEDDVVEVDGKPGRIVRCGVWSTTFFTYDVVDGIIVGGSKLVIQNDKLKDLKIEKPLPLLDLSKYKVDTSCTDLLTELTRVVKNH